MRRLGVNPDRVRAMPWMAGWNAISSMRMGPDEKLWLVAEQDPRPRHDRARHMTSQVYWTDTALRGRGRSRGGRGGVAGAFGVFFPSEALPQDEYDALTTNARMSSAEYVRRLPECLTA